MASEQPHKKDDSDGSAGSTEVMVQFSAAALEFVLFFREAGAGM